MKLAKFLSMIGLMLLAATSYAWDGVVTGTVHGFDITGSNNYAFRVHLNGVAQACNGDTFNFAYINESDENYKTYVAAVMMAKANGSTVTLYVTRAGGACKIGYMTVAG